VELLRSSIDIVNLLEPNKPQIHECVASLSTVITLTLHRYVTGDYTEQHLEHIIRDIKKVENMRTTDEILIEITRLTAY
jgi:tryptophanase